MSLAAEILSVETRLREIGSNPTALCAEAGIARSTWQRWKDGRSSPNFRTWADVEAALNRLLDAAARDASVKGVA